MFHHLNISYYAILSFSNDAVPTTEDIVLDDHDQVCQTHYDMKYLL
jgi:hypothetical protein